MPIISGEGGGGTPFTGGTIAGPLTVYDGGGDGQVEINSSAQVIVTDFGNRAQVITQNAPLTERAQIAPGQITLTDIAAGINLFNALSNGCFFGYTVVPTDVAVESSTFALWLDATPGVGNTKLMIKAKDSGGTVRTAAIVLA